MPDNTTSPRQGTSWLVIALTLALGSAALITLHTVRHVIRVRHGSERVRPWMSIPYIARSHHVSAELLYEALGLPTTRPDRRPLGRIARQQGRPVDELMHRVEAAIAHARGQPPPHRNGTVP